MDDATSVPTTTQRLIAEYGDILPPTFIASTVEAAAALRPADAGSAEHIARADVAAAAEAALRARRAAEPTEVAAL